MRGKFVADGEGRNGVWLAEQGLDVLSIDFSPSAQTKARALAAEREVDVTFEQADVHTWHYPQSAFDVVVEIFTQFSSPSERALKWAGMRRGLKSGGLLIIQGYTPKQLQYGTGGPKHTLAATHGAQTATVSISAHDGYVSDTTYLGCSAAPSTGNTTHPAPASPPNNSSPAEATGTACEQRNASASAAKSATNACDTPSKTVRCTGFGAVYPRPSGARS